jgi:hypothetical protein
MIVWGTMLCLTAVRHVEGYMAPRAKVVHALHLNAHLNSSTFLSHVRRLITTLSLLLSLIFRPLQSSETAIQLDEIRHRHHHEQSRRVIMSKSFPPVQPGGSLILAWQIKDKKVLVVGGGEVCLPKYIL